MPKRLSAKVGEYIDKEGVTKGEYVQVGVLLQGNNGEYLLLDPSVSLAGIMAKQNALEYKKGGVMRDNVMCGIYDEQNNNQQQQYNDPKQQQQGGFQGQKQNQNQHQGQQQNQGQQQGYQQQRG